VPVGVRRQDAAAVDEIELFNLIFRKREYLRWRAGLSRNQDKVRLNLENSFGRAEENSGEKRKWRLCGRSSKMLLKAMKGVGVITPWSS
jgi:hypothetical protein